MADTVRHRLKPLPGDPGREERPENRLRSPAPPVPTLVAMVDGSPDIRTALRAALRERMVARDRPAVGVLRTAIAAIENAEAQPLDAVTQTELHLGAATSTDVARREVPDTEARRLVQAEIDDLVAASQHYGSLGAADASAAASEQADVLRSVLGTSA